jgi:ABC-2 type transport system permease protein
MIGARLPAGGSLLFGLSIALVGWVFIGVAAITAQFAEFSRTANGMATAVLGITFLLRAVGDSAKDIGWLSWLSPIGWSAQTRPFSGDHWWVLPILLVAAVIAACHEHGTTVFHELGTISGRRSRAVC